MDYTEAYEGPEDAVLMNVDNILDDTGDAADDDLSFDHLLTTNPDGETEVDDMDAATAAFEGNGL